MWLCLSIDWLISHTQLDVQHGLHGLLALLIFLCHGVVLCQILKKSDSLRFSISLPEDCQGKKAILGGITVIRILKKT